MSQQYTYTVLVTVDVSPGAGHSPGRIAEAITLALEEGTRETAPFLSAQVDAFRGRLIGPDCDPIGHHTHTRLVRVLPLHSHTPGSSACRIAEAINRAAPTPPPTPAPAPAPRLWAPRVWQRSGTHRQTHMTDGGITYAVVQEATDEYRVYRDGVLAAILPPGGTVRQARESAESIMYTRGEL